MKSYYFHYSLLGGGVLEVKANSLLDADSLVMDISDEILMDQTDFKHGLTIDYIEDEEGNCYEHGEYEEEEEYVDVDVNEEGKGYIVTGKFIDDVDY